MSQVKSAGAWRAMAALLIAASLIWQPIAGWAATGSVEYQVKAAYLSKFGNFVQWPAETGNGAQATICIAGKDPFGQTIDEAVQGRRIGSRDIAVRRLSGMTPDLTAGCQILYVSDGSPEHVSEMLRLVRGQHILTVGDNSGTQDNAPIITFVIQNNNVRFEIDQHAASQNGLVISSQLLALAVAVKPAKQEHAE